MPTKKKQLQEYQVEKILQKRNIILFYQYSNAKGGRMAHFKKKLAGCIFKKYLRDGRRTTC